MLLPGHCFPNTVYLLLLVLLLPGMLPGIVQTPAASGA